MHDHGSLIWGLNVSANGFYMKEGEVFCKWGLVIGSLFGTRNRHDDSLQASCSPLGQHEDVERSCRFIERDGIVLRFKSVAVVSVYQTMPGGCRPVLPQGKNGRRKPVGWLASWQHGGPA